MYLFCIVIMFMLLIIKILKLTLCFWPIVALFWSSLRVYSVRTMWSCTERMWSAVRGNSAHARCKLFHYKSTAVLHLPAVRKAGIPSYHGTYMYNKTEQSQFILQRLNRMGALLPRTVLHIRSVHYHIVQTEYTRSRPKQGKNLSKTQCKFQYFYYQRNKRYNNTV